jgi:hypothetical protein
MVIRRGAVGLAHLMWWRKQEPKQEKVKGKKAARLPRRFFSQIRANFFGGIRI